VRSPRDWKTVDPGRLGVEPWLALEMRRRIPFLRAPTSTAQCAQLADSRLHLFTRRACLMQDSAAELESQKMDVERRLSIEG